MHDQFDFLEYGPRDWRIVVNGAVGQIGYQSRDKAALAAYYWWVITPAYLKGTVSHEVMHAADAIHSQLLKG